MVSTGRGNLKREPLTNSERMEMIGCIIDVIEDFLEARGIAIENDEKKDDYNLAIIYGSDYDELSTGIENVLIDSGILNMKCAVTAKECEMCAKRCGSRY